MVVAGGGVCRDGARSGRERGRRGLRSSRSCGKLGNFLRHCRLVQALLTQDAASPVVKRLSDERHGVVRGLLCSSKRWEITAVPIVNATRCRRGPQIRKELINRIYGEAGAPFGAFKSPGDTKPNWGDKEWVCPRLAGLWGLTRQQTICAPGHRS